MQHMNSFQQWADAYGRAHGWLVTLTGNWVTLEKGGERVECMTVKGVQRACAKT